MSTANNVMSLINTFQRKVTADLIAEYLRDRILDGTFAPSTSINEVHLATQLEISRSPVREAVQRLVQEGLLVSTRNRGTSVVELGPEDIEDVYTARAAIEREAGRLVLRSDTTELTAQLDAVLSDMFQALENDKWHDVATADVKFHQTIVQATGSPRLTRMFSTLAAETLLCVRQFQRVLERREAILEQHRRLRDFIEARDEEGYLAEIEWHLTNSNLTLEAARKQHDSSFRHQSAEGPQAPRRTPPGTSGRLHESRARKKNHMTATSSTLLTDSNRVKRGAAEMLKGGVIMDVVNADEVPQPHGLADRGW